MFVHAAPGGRTEALAREVIGWGKPVYALAHPDNRNLVDLGALEAFTLVDEIAPGVNTHCTIIT